MLPFVETKIVIPNNYFALKIYNEFPFSKRHLTILTIILKCVIQ